MKDIIDVLATSAIDAAHAEMNLAMYMIKNSGSYEKVGDKLDLNEWGMLTSTAALGFIYEYIVKRLPEEQRNSLFEPCFDKAAIGYFQRTGVDNADKLALACMKSVNLDEPKTVFMLGRKACNQQEGMFKGLLTHFGVKYKLI